MSDRGKKWLLLLEMTNTVKETVAGYDFENIKKTAETELSATWSLGRDFAQQKLGALTKRFVK